MNYSRFTETVSTLVHGAALKALARKVRTEVRVIEAKAPDMLGPAKRAHVTNTVVEWLDDQIVFHGKWSFLEAWDQEVIRVIVRSMVEAAVDELRKADPMPDVVEPVTPPPVVADAPVAPPVTPEPPPAA